MHRLGRSHSGSSNANPLHNNIQENPGQDPFGDRAISQNHLGVDGLLANFRRDNINLSPAYILSYIKTDDDQIEFVNAICEKKFGKDNKVLKALAISLGEMNITNSSAQQTIALTIYEKTFGDDSKTLKALAISLGKMNITDSTAHKMIAWAIYEKTFGDDSKTLKALATSLGKMNITNSEAQQSIVWAIYEKTFGEDDETLEALATSLSKMNITDSYAQKVIALSIYDKKFGNDSKTLKAVATILAKMNITNSEAQQIIANIIYDKILGGDEDILKALATSLGEINITDSSAQQTIANIIYEQILGDGEDILKAVVTSLSKMNITDSYAQKKIADAIKENRLGNFTNAQRIISKWLISDANTAQYVYNSAGLSDISINKQFGIFRSFKNNYFKNVQVGDKDFNTDDCFSSEGAGSYGLTYNEDGQPNLLIVYIEDITNINPMDIIQSKFNGFISSGEEQLLYKDSFSNIKVFDLTHSQNHNFPLLLDNLSLSSDKFMVFPRWLQSAIQAQQFDPSKYRHSKIINFVLNFIDGLSFAKDNVGKQCKYIIIKTIQMQGEGFNLSSDMLKNKEIKDDIDAAFNLEGEGVFDEYKTKLDMFWNTLATSDDKLKLVFLLGQIAKSGALGYHVKIENIEYNHANQTFYYLTAYCAQKIIEEYPNNKPVYIEDLCKNLADGKCIEQETNQLLAANTSLFDIWQFK